MQAELGLTISRDNYKEVRQAIAGLNGWQARYRRLDEAGIERAKEIQTLQIRSYRTSCPQKLELLKDRVRDLQKEHVFQNLVSKCRLLRKDIRKALREGALVVPS